MSTTLAASITQGSFPADFDDLVSVVFSVVDTSVLVAQGFVDNISISRRSGSTLRGLWWRGSGQIGLLFPCVDRYNLCTIWCMYIQDTWSVYGRKWYAGSCIERSVC